MSSCKFGYPLTKYRVEGAYVKYTGPLDDGQLEYFTDPSQDKTVFSGVPTAYEADLSLMPWDVTLLADTGTQDSLNFFFVGDAAESPDFFYIDLVSGVSDVEIYGGIRNGLEPVDGSDLTSLVYSGTIVPGKNFLPISATHKDWLVKFTNRGFDNEAVAQPELLSNNTFDNGLSGWVNSSVGQGVSIEVEPAPGSEFDLIFAGVNTAPEGNAQFLAQEYQRFDGLVVGWVYRLTINVRSTQSDESLDVRLLAGTGTDWPESGDRLTLFIAENNPSEATYTGTFTAAETSIYVGIDASGGGVGNNYRIAIREFSLKREVDPGYIPKPFDIRRMSFFKNWGVTYNFSWNAEQTLAPNYSAVSTGDRLILHKEPSPRTFEGVLEELTEQELEELLALVDQFPYIAFQADPDASDNRQNYLGGANIFSKYIRRKGNRNTVPFAIQEIDSQ